MPARNGRSFGRSATGPDWPGIGVPSAVGVGAGTGEGGIGAEGGGGVGVATGVASTVTSGSSARQLRRDASRTAASNDEDRRVMASPFREGGPPDGVLKVARTPPQAILPLA